DVVVRLLVEVADVVHPDALGGELFGHLGRDLTHLVLASAVVAHQEDVLEPDVHHALDGADDDALEGRRIYLDGARIRRRGSAILGERGPRIGVEAARRRYGEWDRRRDDRLAEPLCGFDGAMCR